MCHVGAQPWLSKIVRMSLLPVRLTKEPSKLRSLLATLAGTFLPMQLIYGGKTNQSLPKFKFPESFSLSVNPTHYSNREETIKLIHDILIKKERAKLNLEKNQQALVIMDVFTGQMTSEVLSLLKENYISVTNVPANMTKFYQPLDLTVNGYANDTPK